MRQNYLGKFIYIFYLIKLFQMLPRKFNNNKMYCSILFKFLNFMSMWCHGFKNSLQSTKKAKKKSIKNKHNCKLFNL